MVDYATAEIPDTTSVVNPDYRRLDGQVRSKQGHLTRKLAAFSAMNLTGEIEPKKVAAFEQKKAELQERIEDLTREVAELKTQRKAVKHHRYELRRSGRTDGGRRVWHCGWGG